MKTSALKDTHFISLAHLNCAYHQMPAMHPMKPLEEYDISPKTGFLPPEPPLRRLPDPYFAPWESMMDDFNGLLLAGKLRRSVEKVLFTSRHERGEIKHALTTLYHLDFRCRCLIIVD